MKNIKILLPLKYKDPAKYEEVSPNIFMDRVAYPPDNFRIALSFTLEEGEDTQYPFEDILEQYLVYVSDFLEPKDSLTIMNLELGGEQEDVEKLQELVGKRVYNEEYQGEDGRTYVKLVIE